MLVYQRVDSRYGLTDWLTTIDNWHLDICFRMDAGSHLEPSRPNFWVAVRSYLDTWMVDYSFWECRFFHGWLLWIRRFTCLPVGFTLKSPPFFVQDLFRHVWPTDPCKWPYTWAIGVYNPYTPENKLWTWTHPLGKGETSTNHQFLGSMVNFGGCISYFTLLLTGRGPPCRSKKNTWWSSQLILEIRPIFSIWWRGPNGRAGFEQ